MRRNVIEEVQKEMQRRLGRECDVETVTLQKVGGSVEGISCRFKGDDHAVVLYPDNYQNLLESGMDVKSIGKYLADEAAEKRCALPDLPKTTEEFREGLYVQVVNSEVNQELLKNTVHDSWDDIAAVARCRISKEGEQNVSFMVTKDNMSAFKMTQGEIMERAYKNTAEQEFCIQNMNDTMRELMSSQGIPDEMMDDIIPREESPLFVITNQEKLNGANAIVCPEVLNRAYEQLGEPYYVLPSSTHEVILVRESAGIPAEKMKQMVNDVNLSEVSPGDLLSFKVFRYDGRKLSAVKEDVQEISKTAEKIREKTGKLIR